MFSFWQPLARCWKGFALPRKRQPITRNQSSLRLEVLEGREVPTGNVMASFSGGTLTLNASNSNVPADNDQEVTIIGFGQDSVTVQGANDTTVNFGAGPIDYTGVKNIVMNMNNGNDIVLASTVTVSGNITFNGGAGDDVFTIGDQFGDNTFVGLTFQGGEGDDTLTVQNGIVVGAGATVINGGNGTNDYNFGTQFGDDITLGSLNLTGGSGDDTLQVGGDIFRVNGIVNFSGGAGNNQARFEPELSLALVGTQTTITNQGGDDAAFFGVGATTDVVMNNLSVSGGAGNNDVAFFGATHLVTGNVIINNGTGFDNFQASGNSFQVGGKFQMNNGAGGSNTVLDSDTEITVIGPVNITNSAGVDTTVIGDQGVGEIQLGPVTINNGADVGTVAFQGSTHLILGTLSVTNGTAVGTHTTAAFGDTFRVTGNVTVKNGAANDTFVGFVSAAEVTFDAGVTITNQAGDDVIAFGDVASNVLVAKNLTINNGNGQAQTTFDGALVTIVGNLSHITGASAAVDDFTADADELHIGGTVVINHGAGPSNTFIANIVQGHVGSTFTLTAADGFDTVSISTMNLRQTTLNLGAGGSTVLVNFDVVTEGSVTIGATGAGGSDIDVFAFINGNLGITTGNEDDFVDIIGAVAGNTTINTGNGNDQLTIAFSTFGGTFQANTGNDFDTITIDDSFFNASFNLNAGAGFDTINIETLDSGQSTTFVKQAIINGGADSDDVTVGIDFDLEDRGIFQGPTTFEGGGGTFDQLFIGPPKLNSFAVQPKRNGWAVLA